MSLKVANPTLKKFAPLLPIPVVTLLFLLWVTLGSDPGGASVLGAVAAGLVVGGMASTWLYLLPKFGKYTSVAVISLATSLVTTFVALVAPHCPGYATSTPRCSVPQLLHWSLIGIGFPLLALALIFLLSTAVALFRLFKRIYLRITKGVPDAKNRHSKFSEAIKKSTSVKSSNHPKKDKKIKRHSAYKSRS